MTNERLMEIEAYAGRFGATADDARALIAAVREARGLARRICRQLNGSDSIGESGDWETKYPWLKG